MGIPETQPDWEEAWCAKKLATCHWNLNECDFTRKNIRLDTHKKNTANYRRVTKRKYGECLQG